MIGFKGIIATAIGWILLVGVATAGHAQSTGQDFDLFGISCPGITVSSVAADTVRVIDSVAETRELVSQGEVREVIAKAVFSRPEFAGTIARDTLIGFIRRATEAQNAPVAAIGLTVLLNNEATVSLVAQDLLFEIARAPLGKEVLRRVVLANTAAAKKIDWVAAALSVTEEGDISNDIKVLLSQRLQAKLEREEFPAIRQLLPVITRYTSSTARYINLLLELVDNEANDSAEVLGQVSAMLEDPSITEGVRSASAGLRTTIAQVRVARGDAAEARVQSLQWLRLLEPSARTDATIRKLVSIAQDQQLFCHHIPLIAPTFRAFSLADALIKQRYVDALGACLKSAKDTGASVAGLEPVAAELFRVAPEGTPIVDYGRYLMGITALEQGDRAAALIHIQRIRGSLRASQYWSLLMAGYYVPSFWLFISLITAIITAWIVVARDRFRVRPTPQVRPDKASERSRVADPRAQAQAQTQANPFRVLARKTARNESASDPRVAELIGCLKILELPYGVSERDIKSAFRAKAKAAHPDMHDANDARANEEFILLTKAYERALELVRELAEQ